MRQPRLSIRPETPVFYVIKNKRLSLHSQNNCIIFQYYVRQRISFIFTIGKHVRFEILNQTRCTYIFL